MNWYVYILRCADDSLYTGITSDLDKRVEAHNNSKTAAKYTRGRRPLVLIYHEEYPSKGEALVREAAIKKLSRIEKLKLIRKNK